MSIRIGINGFGRIGRTVARILYQRSQAQPGSFELVAVNDLTGAEDLAYALKYDSVFGRFPDSVSVAGGEMKIGSWSVRVTAQRDPALLDWVSAGVDVVLECTGVFKKRADLTKHLDAGAPVVVLAVPPKDPLDATIVLGVNDDQLDGGQRLVSNASCTTNAAAPLVKVINDSFGIVRGYINTIHAYTNGQSLVDVPQTDRRRGRAAAISIIPTTTGAAKAVTQVIPELAGKLDGMAYRVPVSDGSIVDMALEVSRPVTVAEVNQAVLDASKGRFKGIIEYGTDEIVSVDIIANSHNSIFDSLLTQVIDGRLVHVSTWYDNEWGYSSRVVDLMEKLHHLRK